MMYLHGVEERISKDEAHTVAHAAAPLEPSAPKDSAQTRWNACYEAQNYIKGALKAPTSADFPNCYRQDDLVSTRPTGDKLGGYAVTTYVDAQNSYGAKIRTYFMCPVWFPDADHVKVQCIETDSSHKTTLNVF
jgi:hypothetical protein